MAFMALVALGTTAATATTVATVITYVGIAMTVIGAVTKDKNLMQTGGLLSLVGGIGIPASGAAGEAAAATGEGAAITGDAAVSALDNTSRAAAGEAFDAGMESTLSDTLASEQAAGGLMNTGVVDTAAQTAMPAVSQPGAPMPDGASESMRATQDVGLGPVGAEAPNSPADPFEIDGAVAGSTRVGGAPMDSGTFFTGIGKFWDGLGPQGKGMAIQQIGGAFSGAAETEKHNEIMDYRNRELALRSHGSATANYRRPGLINAPRT